jgi:hypothetical protein
LVSICQLLQNLARSVDFNPDGNLRDPKGTPRLRERALVGMFGSPQFALSPHPGNNTVICSIHSSFDLPYDEFPTYPP